MTEQERFEAEWLTHLQDSASVMDDNPLEKRKDGRYFDPLANAAWWAWERRASMSKAGDTP